MSMHHYDKRRMVAQRVKKWLYTDPKEREHWSAITSWALENYGFGASLCSKIVEEMSAGQLYIDEDGSPQRKKEPPKGAATFPSHDDG